MDDSKENSKLAYKGSVSGLKGLIKQQIHQVTKTIGEGLNRSDEGTENQSRLPIEYIYPAVDQPRQVFDPSSLEELAATLKNLGQIQAITVRRADKGFEIVSGERRYRAAKLAGLTHLDCVIKNCSLEEARMMALVENTQRQDLYPIEEALFIKKVLDDNPQFNLSALAKRLGSHKSTLSEKMKMCEIPDDLQKLFFSQKGRLLTHRHWRVLSRIKDQNYLQQMCQKAVQNNMSVADLERELAAAGIKKQVKKRRSPTLRSKKTLLQKAVVNEELFGETIEWPPIKISHKKLTLQKAQVKLDELSPEKMRSLREQLDKLLLELDSSQRSEEDASGIFSL